MLKTPVSERDKRSALLRASEKGNVEAVKILLDASTPVNGYLLISPVHVAAFWGHLNVVRLLVEAGADINNKKNSGMVVGMGLFPESIHIARKLYKLGYQDLIGCDFTPLLLAIIGRQTEVAKYLINNGADLNIRVIGCNLTTPLHFAAQYSYELCELLIEKGAEINAVDDNWKTPLKWAKRAGQDGIVKLLKSHGAW